MTALTLTAAMAIANACVGPSLAPIMVGIAQHESGLDPAARHLNPNGTWDLGIAQVNTSNLRWTGLTVETAMDPCRNLAAGAKVLFAKYNGNPPDVVKATYAQRVIAAIGSLPEPASPAPAPDPFSRPTATGRDLLASKTKE